MELKVCTRSGNKKGYEACNAKGLQRTGKRAFFFLVTSEWTPDKERESSFKV